MGLCLRHERSALVIRVCIVSYDLCLSILSVFVCCYVADYKRGFGGQYGVEVGRQDQSALGYEYKENLAKHESQKGTNNFLNTSASGFPYFTTPGLCLAIP